MRKYGIFISCPTSIPEGRQYRLKKLPTFSVDLANVVVLLAILHFFVAMQTTSEASATLDSISLNQDCTVHCTGPSADAKFTNAKEYLFFFLSSQNTR